MDSSHPTITTISSTTTTATIPATPTISLSASRKRVKLSPHLSKQQPQIQWRNPAQGNIYNRRLISSLRNLTINSNNSSSPSAPPRAIKDAADSALAMTARGQTRWSRAILSRQWQMRKVVIVKPKVKKRNKEKEGGGRETGEKKKVNDKLRLLGNLVPGCRKVAMEDLLEETADYVAALELQVKAMKALSDALSSFSSLSTSSSATVGVFYSSGTPPP